MKQMICQDCGNTQPYHQEGHDGEYRCHICGGEWCGCNSCNALIEALENQDYVTANKMIGNGKITEWDCAAGWTLEK